MPPLPFYKTQVLSLLVAFCCAATTFGAVPPRGPAVAQAGKKVASKISLSPASPSVETGKTIIVTATVTDKKDVVIPKAQVKWWVDGPNEGFVLLSPSASTRQVIIAGLTPPAGSTPPATIELFARSGEAEESILIEYKPTGQAASGSIVLEKTEIELTPGTRGEITAEALSASKAPIPPTEVKWVDDDRYDEFVEAGVPYTRGNKSVLPVFAFFGDPSKTPPTSVPIMVKAAGVTAVVLVHYKSASASPNKIVQERPREDERFSIEPGKTEVLEVKVLGADDQPVPGAKVEWEALGDGSQFVSLNPDPKDSRKVTVTGLFGPEGVSRKPYNIPIVARVGTASRVIDLAYAATVEPQVDLSWDVLPQEIVGDNYGRSIKKEYYCVEVMVGNNSGNDLQLAGLGFELPEIARDGQGGAQKDGFGVTKFAETTGADGKAVTRVAGVVPVSSYATVRGSLAKRKVMHPRSFVLAGLNAFGPFLGGFAPFFVNPSHSNNFVNGVNIISNPLTKGVDQVWPDSYPGELERLDQHALRDDKIIPNNTTFKTRVFFPKDALFQHNEPGRDDIREVRRRLGRLILVGHVIERKGFVNRLRFGSTVANP